MDGSIGIGAGRARAAINDCWNTIGVHGDGSCPELERHIHCRNCPAYAAAASALLDRDTVSADVEESTRHYSVERKAEASDTRSIVIFRIGPEWLGLPTRMFSEFVDLRTIHSLPHRPDKIVLGVANVRGELLVCVSLAEVLGIGRAPLSQTARVGAACPRLVVVGERRSRIAFPVDEVHGTHKFSPDQLTQVPATVSRIPATYTKSLLPWNGVAVGCLDDELLLYTLNRSLA